VKIADVKKLPHGLYKVYWKTGGMSLASVGSTPNGNRWLAPTNWVRLLSDNDNANIVWRGVFRVEHIQIDQK